MNRYLTLIALAASGCATVIRNPASEPGKFMEAIQRNDADAARNMLKGKSFIGTTLTFGEDHNASGYRQMLDANTYDLLDLAIIGNARGFTLHAPTGICRTGIVSAMLDAKLPPRTIDLIHAGEVPCPDVMEVLLTKLSPTEAADATGAILSAIKEKLRNRENIGSRGWDEALKVLAGRSDSATRARIEAVGQLVEQFIHKPIRDSQASKRRFESEFNMNFCQNVDLFNILYNPYGATIESDCMYLVHGPLKVLQTITGGILVTTSELLPYTLDKIFFIKTDREYADQDFIENMLVRSNGTIKYSTVLGIEKTVRAFQHLRNVKLAHGSNRNEISFEPNQD